MHFIDAISIMEKRHDSKVSGHQKVNSHKQKNKWVRLRQENVNTLNENQATLTNSEAS